MANYMVQDTEMKAVADAIRAKAGTTDLLTWPDGYEARIAEIQAGDFRTISPYVQLTEEFITISANTVTNAVDARAYLSALLNDNEMVFIQNSATENNQVICYCKGLLKFCIRIRNGVLSDISSAGDLYDAFLVEGTKYNIARVRVPV